MARWAVHALMSVMLTAVFFSCGYHFAGSGSFPAGVSRIFITLLENRSAETGAESIFTSDLIFEFTRNRKENLPPMAFCPAPSFRCPWKIFPVPPFQQQWSVG